jgi:predicted DNA-binding antitoxin AbrB/MazE fold protein
MAKLGFSDQWVEICKVGTATDSNGVARDLSVDFINQVIANYNASTHEAPAVIGHPEENAPAYGWVTNLRLKGDVLEAKFSDVADEFETAVRNGSYRKRSASFYLKPVPNLRHVGFLGAQPPAIKGLQNIQFNEGEAFTIEVINFQEKTMNEKDIENLPESFWEKFRNKFNLGEKTEPVVVGDPNAGTNFSEAKVQEMINAAVAASETKTKADFAEQSKAKDEKLANLEAQMNASSASGKRSEIASFVDSIPAEHGKYILKNNGVVEFLESLAVADANDKELAINFSEGEGDKKVEVKMSRLDWAKKMFSSLPRTMQFGEVLGGLKVDVAEFAEVPVNEATVADLKKSMGIKKADGGEK